MSKYSLTLTTRMGAAQILAHLGDLYSAQLDLDTAKTNAVARARRLDLSWETIGDELNISRQAAWERWHHLDASISD
jgi:hypothetical protein